MTQQYKKYKLLTKDLTFNAGRLLDILIKRPIVLEGDGWWQEEYQTIFTTAVWYEGKLQYNQLNPIPDGTCVFYYCTDGEIE